MTKGELARYIKDLECKYTEFVASKFAKGLSLGHCNLECLEQKAFLVKETIKVLQRFYNEGKLCEGTCELVGSTFTVTSCCTADPNGFSGSIATPYTCYYVFNDSGEMGESIVGSSIVFGASTVTVTKPNGTSTTVSYTYDETTSLITATIFTGGGVHIPVFTLTINEDCTSADIKFSAANSAASFLGITYELYGDFSTSSSDDCDWQEYCITEDEALDMYKKAKQIIGTKCNCH